MNIPTSIRRSGHGSGGDFLFTLNCHRVLIYNSVQISSKNSEHRIGTLACNSRDPNHRQQHRCAIRSLFRSTEFMADTPNILSLPSSFSGKACRMGARVSDIGFRSRRDPRRRQKTWGACEKMNKTRVNAIVDGFALMCFACLVAQGFSLSTCFHLAAEDWGKAQKVVVQADRLLCSGASAAMNGVPSISGSRWRFSRSSPSICSCIGAGSTGLFAVGRQMHRAHGL